MRGPCERDNLDALIQRAAVDSRYDYVWRLPHTMYGMYRRYGFYDELITAAATPSSDAHGSDRNRCLHWTD